MMNLDLQRVASHAGWVRPHMRSGRKKSRLIWPDGQEKVLDRGKLEAKMSLIGGVRSKLPWSTVGGRRPLSERAGES